ncbi:MAG: hypothetical protein HY943_20680 [Gammaproteobacteria bacterium]|nr:hypothetical protein [Gammaproteobacteria bacterium]
MSRPSPRLFPMLLVWLAGLWAAGADAATYASAPTAYNWITTGAETTITSWSTSSGCVDSVGDDSLSNALNLGFTFNYGGTNYTQLRIFTNGHVQFNSTYCGYGTNNIGPPRTYPDGMPNTNQDRTIRIYGADLDVSAAGSGTITYATTGSSPNRVFVVSWNNVRAWTDTGSGFGGGTSYNFQIQIYESGEFRYMYGTSDDISTAGKPVGPAQVGWQVSGSDYVIQQYGLPANGSGLRFFIPGGAGSGTGCNIPATYPLYGGTLSVGSGTVNNGSTTKTITAASGTGKALNAATGALVSYTPTLPALNPATFPTNGSTTDSTSTTIAAGSYRTLTPSGNFTFTGGTYYIKTLNLAGRTATIAPGDYYIETLNISNNGKITISPNGPVNIYIKTRVAGSGADHVSINSGGSPQNMRFWLYPAATFAIKDDSTFTGLLYAPDAGNTVSFASTNTITGAVISAGSLSVGSSASIVFTSTTANFIGSIATSTCTSTSDHIALSGSTTAVTCAATSVTVTIHKADHGVNTAFTGAVALSTSTSHGDWTLASGSGTFDNGAANDGAATYTFVAGDAGTAQFTLKDTVVETANLDATDGSISETTGSATAAEDLGIAFAQTGFLFLADGVNGAIGNQIAGKSSGTAPGAQTLTLAAVRTSDSTGVCQAALGGAQTVSLAYECISPATCAGSTFQIGSTTIAANASGTVSGYASVPLTFDAATGRAAFTATYQDAGSTRLTARYQIPLPDGAGSGQYMTGTSNTFGWRPFALEFQVTGNPAASSAAGTRFKAAGASFDATLRAVAWSAAADTNNDGVADGHQSGDTSATNNASLTANATTPNFTPGVAASLSARLDQPAGGHAPALGGTTSATLGSGTANVTGLLYDEVGIIELTAIQGGSYLGMGTTETAQIRGVTGYVGRFYPSRFNVAGNTPVFAAGCTAGSFTYLDQGFGFSTAPALTVTALNVAGVATQNYTTAGFFKLATALANRAYGDSSGATASFSSLLAGTTTLAGNTGGTGSATLSLANGGSGDQFLYGRTSLVAPFVPTVTAAFPAGDLTDSDGVCYDPNGDHTCDPYQIAGIAAGGATLRFGRLKLVDAVGSEVLPLEVPARAEYYDGQGFVANTSDSCTAITTAALDLKTTASNPAQGTASVAIGGGTTTASFAHVPLAAGTLSLNFSAPGAGHTGDVDATINLGASGANAAWLRYDWDGNGAQDNDPAARAGFGVYAGRKAVIYQRDPWR